MSVLRLHHAENRMCRKYLLPNVKAEGEHVRVLFEYFAGRQLDPGHNYSTLVVTEKLIENKSMLDCFRSTWFGVALEYISGLRETLLSKFENNDSALDDLLR